MKVPEIPRTNDNVNNRRGKTYHVVQASKDLKRIIQGYDLVAMIIQENRKWKRSGKIEIAAHINVNSSTAAIPHKNFLME